MKPYLKICLFTLPLLPVTAPVTGAEQVAPQKSHSAPAHSHRGPKQLMLENADGAEITLWKPDLSTQSLTTKHGGITIPKTGMNSYHALVVEKDWGSGKETVIRYEYLHGPPSKQSPSKLAAAVKTDFEIVPAPIPREHYRYHSDQHWGFQVRLHGQPSVDTLLLLETEHGTQLRAVTDREGMASFLLPDDFPNIVPGQRDERSAEFTVSAVTEADGINYETMLTAAYRVNPAHWQSSLWGWAVVGLGFIAGGLIGRQKKGEAA